VTVTKVGKYELVRKLASGGMAEVFLARWEWAHGLEKMVVVKRILEHMSEEPYFIEMFLSEAQLASQLSHPNIVQIIEFGESEGVHFLAMEYIDGLSLRALLRACAERGERLPFAHCARIVASAGEALAYAHDLVDPATEVPLQIVHRDVSLDNILLSKAGAVKLVDFGIAKAVIQVHRTRTGVVKGKLSYMSPEQIRGEPLDRRVDIYGLGVVLYELITGEKPFEAANEAQLLHAITREGRIPVRTRRPDTPPELERIVNRALERDRGLRYSDCRVMHAELEGFLLSCGQPINAFQLAELIKQYSGDARSAGAPAAASSPSPELPPTRAAPQEASVTGSLPDLPADPGVTGPRPAGQEVTGEEVTADPVAITVARPPPGHDRSGPVRRPTQSGPRARVTRGELVALFTKRSGISVPAGLALFLGALVVVLVMRGIPDSLPPAATVDAGAVAAVPPPAPVLDLTLLEANRAKARELLENARRVLAAGRDPGDAEPFLVACLQFDANNADCHLALSTMHVRQKNRAQALEHVRKFLKLEPDRAAEAQEVFQELRALRPRSTRVRAPVARGVASGGAKAGTKTTAPRGGPDPDPEPEPGPGPGPENEPSDEAVAAALCEEGKTLLKQMRYQQASYLFASCVELDKDNAECHLGLGTSWTRLGNPQKAAPSYEEFLRLAPNHALAKEVRRALRR